MPRFSLTLITGLCCAAFGGTLFAAEPAAQPSVAENRLRESLRATMLQLRSSENEKAVLQATQAESDEKIKTLTEQLEKLSKQIVADKDASDKAIAELKGQVEERAKTIIEVKEVAFKLQADLKKMTEIATTKEAQRAKLDEQVIQLNRRVADQQTKNAGMFKIANEILVRYEKFGFGDALTAREPFTGITRVKLQSLFEDYQDKLADQKIKPLEAKAPATTPAPTTTKAAKANTGATKTAEQKPKP